MIDNNSNFSSPEINTGAVSSGSKSYTAGLGQLAQNQTYWWRIAVRDAYGWTGWTGCNSFWLPSRAPSAVNLAVSSQPACYSCSVCKNTKPQPTLSWIFSDPDYNDYQSAYQIQIDNNSNFSSLELNTGKVSSGASSYDIPSGVLNCGATYYWRVKVWDKHGIESSWSNSSFNTSPACNNPPSATNLQVVQPDYCVFGPTGIFSWIFTDVDLGDLNCDERQTAYRIQVDNNSNFSSPEDDSGKISSDSNSYATPAGKLSYNTTYYWRLMVWDRFDAASSWINGSSFTTPLHVYPSIDFDWSPSEPSVEEDIIFTDQSTVYGGATKSAWSWTFEDGNPGSSNEQNPIIQFTSDGSKSVTLQVTDSDGYACSSSKSVNVQIELPEWKEVAPFGWLRSSWPEFKKLFATISVLI
jgi:hypothetical protein